MNTRRKKAIADLGITLEECDSEDRDETYSDVAEALSEILLLEEASRVKYVQESRNYRKDQAHRDTYTTYAEDSARCQRLISDAVELLRNHSLVDTVLEPLLEITKKAPDAVFKAPPVQETASVSRSMEDMIQPVNYMWSIEWYLKGELKSLLEESDVEGNYKRWKEYEHTQTMRVAAARNPREASVISENLFNMYKSSGKDAIELLIKARDIYHKLLRYESRRLSGERPTQEDG